MLNMEVPYSMRDLLLFTQSSHASRDRYYTNYTIVFVISITEEKYTSIPASLSV